MIVLVGEFSRSSPRLGGDFNVACSGSGFWKGRGRKVCGGMWGGWKRGKVGRRMCVELGWPFSREVGPLSSLALFPPSVVWSVPHALMYATGQCHSSSR